MARKSTKRRSRPARKAEAATRKPKTRKYRVEGRTLSIVGVGLLRVGDEAWLTDGQYQANQKSLRLLEDPDVQNENDGAGGKGGADQDGAGKTGGDKESGGKGAGGDKRNGAPQDEPNRKEPPLKTR